MAGEEGLKRIELKVSVDCCDGCKKKVLKALSIKGVLKMEIHPSQPLVTVTGNVDAGTLVKRLAKYGKVAEVLPTEDKRQEKGGDKNVEMGEGTGKDKSKEGKRHKKASTEQEKSSKCCEANKSIKAEVVEVDMSIKKSPKMTESCNESSGGKQTDEALKVENPSIATAAAAAVTAPTPQVNCMVNPGMMQGAMFTHASAPRVYYPMEQCMYPVAYPMPNTYSAPGTSVLQHGYQQTIHPAAATQLPPPCHCCRDPYHHHYNPQHPLPRLTDYFNDDNTGSCRVM